MEIQMELAICNLIVSIIVLLFYSSNRLYLNICINFGAVLGIIASILCFSTGYVMIAGIILVSFLLIFVLVLPGSGYPTLLFKLFTLILFIANILTIFGFFNIFPGLNLI